LPFEDDIERRGREREREEEERGEGEAFLAARSARRGTGAAVEALVLLCCPLSSRWARGAQPRIRRTKRGGLLMGGGVSLCSETRVLAFCAILVAR
jgi:hypothetical protein